MKRLFKSYSLIILGTLLIVVNSCNMHPKISDNNTSNVHAEPNNRPTPQETMESTARQVADPVRDFIKETDWNAVGNSVVDFLKQSGETLNDWWNEEIETDENIEQARVKRVIDGDTFELTDGRRVRLLGVDTPERGSSGFHEATEFTRALVEGRLVWLERDLGNNDTDRYDRLLRYVWLIEPTNVNDTDDIINNMLNAQLLVNDYANVLIIGNTKNEQVFKNIQSNR